MTDPTPGKPGLALVDDFWWVLENAWSVRFNILAAIFAAVAATIGVITAYQVELPIGPITLSVVCGVTTLCASLAALAARFVKQDRANPDASE